MEHHSFVCGSSKSRERDAYYIYHNNRFWGTLDEAGITDTQLEPEEYRTLGQEYGIYLAEIVDPSKYRVASDSEIQPEQVKDGLRTLEARIEEHEPNRLAFVGKNAATWFYRHIKGRPITHSQASGHKRDRRDLNGLALDWDYNGLDYYLLSNTHRHWDRDVWMVFWELCRTDVEQFGAPTQQFRVGDRVRLDIPDEDDPDFSHHRHSGTVTGVFLDGPQRHW